MNISTRLSFVKIHLGYIVLIALHVLISLFASKSYSGHQGVFFLFSTLALILILTAIYLRLSFFIFYTGILLYLGFFLKLTAHLIFNYGYVEPTGFFDYSAASWDHVLLVSSLGFCAYVMSSFSLMKCAAFRRQCMLSHSPVMFNKLFYLNNTVPIVLIFLVMVLAYINFTYRIDIRGLKPAIMFPWPFHSLYQWFLNFGLFFVIVYYFDKSVSPPKKLCISYWVLILSTFMISISVLSRGIFLVVVGPILYAIFYFRVKLNLSKAVFLKKSILTIILFVLSVYASNALRNAIYTEVASEGFSEEQANLAHQQANLAHQQANLAHQQVMRLVVDRWIGLEGVMAVTAYPEKNKDLIFDNIFKKQQPGEQDVYSSISNSKYDITKKYINMSIPGPIGYFLYSDSFGYVFVGFILLFGMFFLFEVFISQLFGSIFITSFFSFSFAIHFTQFGIFPRQIVIFYAVTFSVCFLIKTFEKIIVDRKGIEVESV